MTLLMRKNVQTLRVPECQPTCSKYDGHTLFHKLRNQLIDDDHRSRDKSQSLNIDEWLRHKEFLKQALLHE